MKLEYGDSIQVKRILIKFCLYQSQFFYDKVSNSKFLLRFEKKKVDYLQLLLGYFSGKKWEDQFLNISTFIRYDLLYFCLLNKK